MCLCGHSICCKFLFLGILIHIWRKCSNLLRKEQMFNSLSNSTVCSDGTCPRDMPVLWAARSSEYSSSFKAVQVLVQNPQPVRQRWRTGLCAALSFCAREWSAAEVPFTAYSMSFGNVFCITCHWQCVVGRLAEGSIKGKHFQNVKYELHFILPLSKYNIKKGINQKIHG